MDKFFDYYEVRSGVFNIPTRLYIGVACGVAGFYVAKKILKASKSTSTGIVGLGIIYGLNFDITAPLALCGLITYGGLELFNATYHKISNLKLLSQSPKCSCCESE